jgi:F0F1-type ATP synthase assembly protein I
MQQDWKGINRYATVGLEFALSLLVGLFGGRWLQGKLGTGNWLTFVGFGFGIAAGYRAIYRAVQAANRDAEREEAAEQAERQRYHDESSRALPDGSRADQPPSEGGGRDPKHLN